MRKNFIQKQDHKIRHQQKRLENVEEPYMNLARNLREG
jgi:hypothetical protein